MFWPPIGHKLFAAVSLQRLRNAGVEVRRKTVGLVHVYEGSDASSLANCGNLTAVFQTCSRSLRRRTDPTKFLGLYRVPRFGPNRGATASLVSASLPERAMSASAGHTLLTCRLCLARCCSRSWGHILPGPSPPCRPMRPSAHFRVLLLRRLRLLLPLAARTCRCRGRLDPLGAHSACATSGVLAACAPT